MFFLIEHRMLRRSYPASSPVSRPLDRPELRAPGPRVPIDLAPTAPRGASSECRRCPQPATIETCHHAILERVKRQDCQPPRRCQPFSRSREKSIQTLEFLVDPDSDCLEGSRRWIDTCEPLMRNRPPHDVRQLPGRPDAPRLSRFHDRACHAARDALRPTRKSGLPALSPRLRPASRPPSFHSTYPCACREAHLA